MKFDISESARASVRSLELAKYDRLYFSAEYWKEDLAGQSGNRGLSYEDPEHVVRFRTLADALALLSPFASLLDAGCGIGGLLRALECNCEAELVGVDASKDGVELALEFIAEASMIRVYQAELRCLPFPERRFHIVACLDVLEHLPVFDVNDCLEELFRVCADTLIFSINTDNPYKYHPTILSKDTWRAMLDSREGWRRNVVVEIILPESVSLVRPEYDFYCYSRIL